MRPDVRAAVGETMALPVVEAPVTVSSTLPLTPLFIDTGLPNTVTFSSLII